MDSEFIIHVIDDDDAVRDSLLILLKSEDMVVRTYASAEDFLSGLPVPSEGCIVTDLQMPRVDGLELLRRLRARRVRLPVILMSGRGGLNLARDAMRHGAAHFIRKPFEAEVMLSAIRGLAAPRNPAAG